MRLNFNSNGLVNPVINSLDNTINSLSEAISMANNLSIPGGFGGASTLANLDNFLSAEKDKLSYAKDWANRGIRDYTNLESEILKSARTIKPEIIKIREGNIK